MSRMDYISGRSPDVYTQQAELSKAKITMISKVNKAKSTKKVCFGIGGATLALSMLILFSETFGAMETILLVLFIVSGIGWIGYGAYTHTQQTKNMERLIDLGGQRTYSASSR